MKLLTVTNGPTWPGNEPLPAAGTEVGTAYFVPLQRGTDGTAATIGGYLARIVSDGTGLTLKGASGGAFKLLGSTRTLGETRAPRYTLEERLTVGGRVLRQEDLVEPYEGAPGSWDYRTAPPGGIQYVDGLPLTMAEIQTVIDQSRNSTAEVGRVLADLDRRSQGLAGLNIRNQDNAYTAAGVGVLWGLEVGERLPVYLDLAGKLRVVALAVTTLDVATLNVTTLNLTGGLTASAATVGRLTSTQAVTQVQTTGKATSAPGPDGSGVVWGVTDRNDRLAIWLDDAGTFHAAQFGTEFGSGGGGSGGGGGGGSGTGSSSVNVLTTRTLDLEGGDLTTVNGPDVAWGLADRNDRLILWVDFSGVVHLSRPAGAPNADLALWGADLTDGLASRLAGSLGRAINLGLPGQTAADVAARFGALGRAATFTATSAVGNVHALTLLNSEYSPLSGSLDRSQTGRLNGVRGTLRRGASGQADAVTNRGAYYTFTPDGAGTLELNAVHAWIPDNPYRNHTTVIAVGRNDLTGTGTDAELRGRAVAAHVQTILQTLASRHDRYVVLGLLNSSAEKWGAGLDKIMAYNALIAGVAGDRYLDLRSILCRNADGSWRVDGTPNPSYMATATLPNATGYGLIVTALTAFREERGF